jgi:hypothetical protein
MKYRTSLALLAAARADLSNVLGVTHIDGQYYFTNQDYLTEGANQVLASGTKSIKLEMSYQYATKYDWNYTWPGGISSLTQLAQQAPFQSVFSKPFNTYVITTYGIGTGKGQDDTEYWLNGFNNDYNNSTSNASLEKKQFHDFAAYLMNTYRGTGKTFVLENWEGDWALRDTNHDRNVQPTQTQVDNMVNWFDARQAGINQARAEITNSDVHVYQAIEVNRPTDSIKESVGAGTWLTVSNDVLPRTDADLASYSSYDSQQVTTGTLSFLSSVNYIASKLPATAVFGQSLHSVGVGEFGRPEDTAGASGVNAAMNNVINTVTANGMPYAMYWEIYSNELKTGATAPVTDNASVNGFWLVKPDGTPGQAWHQYRQRLITADVTRATTGAVKTGLTDVYQNNFNNNGAALPSYWTVSNGGGAVTSSVNGNRFEMKFTGNVSSTPYAEATLNVNNVIGRGLKPGEYLEFTMRRENDAGIVGVGAFGLHHGSAIGAGTSSPLQIWPISSWVPFSTGANGATTNYNFDITHTLGLRLDTADGNFATVSYYLDGAYSGSWIYKTPATTLTSFSLFAQDNIANAGFEFDNLNVFASAVPGDTNLDGVVNTADFNALASHFNTTGSGVWMQGDFNNDGIVNALDFNVLAARFGQSMSAPALGGLVPEPSTAISMVGVALCALAARRRR